jgi:hypothetical protein
MTICGFECEMSNVWMWNFKLNVCVQYEMSNWIIIESEKKLYTWYLFCTMNELLWHSNDVFIQAHIETVEK